MNYRHAALFQVLTIALAFLAVGPTAQAKERSAPTRGQPQIEIKSDTGRRVEVGDSVGFRIRANRDGFVHVYVASASGRMQLWMENVPIKAGHSLRYPADADADIEIVATAPLGKDRLLAVLTKKRFDGFTSRAAHVTPIDLDLDASEFMEAIEAKLEKQTGGYWTWGGATVETAY